MKTYPNFYVDLAYVVATPMRSEYMKKALAYHPEIKKRIIFGSDWWMYTMESGFGQNSYQKYFEKYCNWILSFDDKKFLEKAEVKSPEELLAYFTVLNPMKFMRLKEVMPKLSTAFYQDRKLKTNNVQFGPDEWIQSVPEKIEDFYK